LLQTQPYRASNEEIASRKKRRAAEQLTKQKSVADQDVSTPALANEEGSRIEAEYEKQKPAITGRPDATHGNAGTSALEQSESIKVDASDYASAHVGVAEPQPVSHMYSFFLLRPRTNSSRQVLIPLDPHARLADCLRGRTVLEFPTIYAFPVTDQPPPAEFMLEQEYIIEEGEQQKEFEDLIKDISPETLRALKASDDDDVASAEIDSKVILDVLKQDLGAGM
jgi:hypothetical protein